MNRETLVTFKFYSFVRHSTGAGAAYKRTVSKKAKGFDTMPHAEYWGTHQASIISVQLGEPYYLGNVVVDSKNFICLATPDTYADGVIIMEAEGCQP